MGIDKWNTKTSMYENLVCDINVSGMRASPPRMKPIEFAQGYGQFDAQQDRYSSTVTRWFFGFWKRV